MRLHTLWIVWPALVLTCCAPASAEERLWLVRDGRAAAVIVRGEEDAFAAERLQSWLNEKWGAEVDVRPAGADRLPDEGCVVLLGSAGSNPLLGEMARKLGLNLDPAELTDQGYVARRVCHDGRDWLILAGGCA